jgi:hypothetical protein
LLSAPKGDKLIDVFKKLICIALTAASVFAADLYTPENKTVNLAFDASPDHARVAGYRLYNGNAVFLDLPKNDLSQIGALPLAFGFVTPILPAGVYAFSLTAYDLAGQESVRSNTLTVEALPPLRPPQALRPN